jgi:hypothetical protein
VNRIICLHRGIGALALGLCGLTGCSTGKTAGPPVKYAVAPPKTFYISDFYIDPSQIRNESLLQGEGPIRSRLQELRGDDPAAKARKLVRALSDSIVGHLNDAGLHAEPLRGQADLRAEFIPANADLPKEGWLVGGWFTKVDEGNRAMQATVGFEMGAEKVEIQVIVSNLAQDPATPFLFTGSETGAHRMPGGVISKNPYAMAARYVLARGATERDVKKQGAAIAANLVEYLKTGTAAGQ